ncbi:uncharacterized protein MELLADRAFT_95643 [Melampsora larici-populina 98AG31]|uniref:DM2 domain-containing protein n=1 Tax=Melampsora larici-populina (strain 98AG31 / pathotype 3-4-7) TaxID=747676 RepID=F4SA25_MELLP|nr:uncharacterized protein MELLADRAFT_95643 [Melampsora larici-populina 98AG31]EGF98474.1 hypothetical protein MELLADRAFT_95643 [Melampsora larici-populina 98AG31]
MATDEEIELVESLQAQLKKAEEVIENHNKVLKLAQHDKKLLKGLHDQKSAAFVDSKHHDPNTNDGHKPKKTKKTLRPPGSELDPNTSNKGIHEYLDCSTALGDVIGVSTCLCPQVVEKIWAYIKANNLQDPKDKEKVSCDGKLKTSFNNQTHMFTMNVWQSLFLFIYL